MSLRHSFAVATLVSWYREGADVDARMPLLSTGWYVDPADTFWYISASPELMAQAAERMARVYGTPRRPHEPSRPGPAGLFHRQADHAEAREPPHDQRLPGHLAPAAHLRQQATGTPAWKMNLSQLDHDLVTGFLRCLETDGATA